MNKISAITILSIFLLMLPFSNLFADSEYDIDTEEILNIQNRDSLVHLAQADTFSQNTNDDSTDMNEDLSDMDDDLFGDDFADEMEDLEKPHETIADPLEPFNRAMFHFNDKLYFWMLKPASKGYSAVVPEPGRRGVKNFFKNICFPVRFVSCIFQGKFKGAGTEFNRFLINSTVGLAGFMDVAANTFNMMEYDEDIAQTLGSYGIGHGFFINWPILGPSSVTRTIGSAGDAFLEPLNYVDMESKYKLAINGFELVNDTSLGLGKDYEDLKNAALDPYVAYRNAFYQLWQNEIKK